MDVRRIERASEKILDVFSDGRITTGELIYVAMHTVMNAHPPVVLDRIIEFTEQLKWEMAQREKANRYGNETPLF